MTSWTLAVDRTDLARTRLTETPVPQVGPGQALLRADRVGVTANNVTYAVLGRAFRYWEFFPTDEGWGIVPLWGFADVVESQADGVEVGSRFYGYLPCSGYLLVEPGRVDERGFRDASAHRATLPSPYNAYAVTTGDAAYDPDKEDLQVLYRPLFFTSWMLADWLLDNDLRGAQAVLLSSASSKTSYGAAFELKRQGQRVIGATSTRNRAFTESLGCYDAVVTYDGLDQLDPALSVVYADVAGDADLTQALRDRLGAAFVAHTVVGVTHQAPAAAGTLKETGASAFFAPDQMGKRTQDWGKAGLDERFAEAWQAFSPVVEGWVDVEVSTGPQALEHVWLEVQGGRTAPRVGHVVTFPSDDGNAVA
jgi:NADPH:quinone reductase-like Zn-dependent oxidoreductase